MMNDVPDLIKEQKLEILIGYCFKDLRLRSRAITRKAWINDQGPGNEINYPGLATLGDAVIGLIVTSHYFDLGMSPGEITNEKIKSVSRENHTLIARGIGLKECLKLGKCEGEDDKWNNGSALGESLEEVIGAVYFDNINDGENGIDACYEVLKKIALIQDRF